MKVNYLLLDGVDITTGDLLFFPRNLFNDESEVILNDTYTTGKSYNRAKLNPRQFVLNGIIKANQGENIRLLSQRLNGELLNTLTVGVADAPERYIKFKKTSIEYDEPWMDRVSVACISPDPRFYASTEDSFQLGLVSLTPLTYPVTYPIEYGPMDGSSGIITNLGNANGYPKFTIIGSCSAITIANTTTGESMDLAITLTDSDTLVVDGGAKIITLNGTKRMDLKDGDWITAIPGENVIEFTRTTIQTIKHCTVNFRSVWI